MDADSVTGQITGYRERMDEFRGIVFRDGPTGRRAALAGGPDVWELMAAIKSGKARGVEAISATAELLNLTDCQVRTAVRYYGAFLTRSIDASPLTSKALTIWPVLVEVWLSGLRSQKKSYLLSGVLGRL
jgi:hypothetical protein